MADGVQVVIGVDYHHGVFPQLDGLQWFGKLQAGLSFGSSAFGFDQYFAFDLASQDDDPPCLIPGGEFECCFHPLKAFANVLPVLT